MRCAGFRTMALLFVLGLFLAGCGQSKGDPKAEAPPPAKVESEQDLNVFQVDRPEQFPLATAVAHDSASQLTVTGTVTPDITRSVPVISIATGRVVELHARLGDTVKKGQLLLRVQSADMSAAFSDYRKAVADGKLARIQFERAKLLYDKGAISLNDFQTAEDVENKAQVDMENTTERIRVLGGNVDHPAAIVDVRTPGIMRVGMFVTATFHGQKKETHAVVPATAILHLHDRNWVYVPASDKKFRRVEVMDGQMLPGNMQEVISGIKPGVQVVQNALVFQNTVEQ